MPHNGGWVCATCLREGHANQFASPVEVWQDHLFDPFLKRVNETQAPADRLGFYDDIGSGANLVQTSDSRIFARIGGYIPMGRALEPIPDLTTRPAGAAPTLAADGKIPAAHPVLEKPVAEITGSIGGAKPVVTVGEFVN